MAHNYGTAGIHDATARRRGQRIARAEALIIGNPRPESRYFIFCSVSLGHIYRAPAIVSSPADWQRRS
jgi:hypothetical protein